MRKILFVVFLSIGALSSLAQEKVMNMLKTDGTTAQTRVADLKQINFLTTYDEGQGLIVKTLAGETTVVLFETIPVVTVSNGKLIVKSSTADDVEFEITDIAEIVFGKESTAINDLKGFACVLEDGAVLLRGIPSGAKPHVYSLDGRSLPTPSFQGDELRLNRSTLGTGIFIVKVGSFSTKIKL